MSLSQQQILLHIRDKGPLTKPEGCPDWVYIIMHQCWTYDPVQRPPFIAIFDCLTSRLVDLCHCVLLKLKIKTPYSKHIVLWAETPLANNLWIKTFVLYHSSITLIVLISQWINFWIYRFFSKQQISVNHLINSGR